MLSLPRNGQQLDNVPQMVPPPPPSPHVVPYVTSPTLPPIPLYPTGKAALIPTPMAYELIPNRIFVGGFPTSTTETELREHFDAFFPVKDVKMVKSLDGVSKGYGFITFETEDQAEAIRKLNPKQLEFRNRKLNLGPAIRNINANIFPPGFPGYLITTPSPSPFAVSPYSMPGSPQVFVYPPVVANPEAKSPSEPRSPPLSPQQGQVFFPEQQEPVRTYANAVSVLPGVEKSSEPEQQGSPKQQSPVPNAQQQPQYQQQWNGPEIVEMPMQDGSQVYPIYHPNGNEKGYQQVQVQMPFYFGGQNGMYQYQHHGVTYLAPPAFPLMQAPYYPQQPAPQQLPYNQQNNGYVGPAGDFHNQEVYYGGNGYQGRYHEENTSFRPLQAPRAGKKGRKTSERMNNGGSHEKNGYQPVPMQLYMNSQGMYQQSMNYMTPPPYPMQQPYWIQPPQHQNFGYNNNGHHQNHQHHNNVYDGHQQEVYYGGYQGNGGYHGGNDENAFPRPLQAASGKKSWKENLEKKKSPSKGSRSDKSSPSSRTTSTSSPSTNNSTSTPSKSPIPSLTDSMQSLTVQQQSPPSPAKN